MIEAALITIVIPTYNRVETLLRCVRGILPQLDDQCRLVVLDNASPVQVREELEKIVPTDAAARVRYARNQCNVGGNANVTRCLEQAVEGWVWILGDDDIPLPDAVKSIRKGVADHAEACVLTFHVSAMKLASSGRLLAPSVSQGMREYLSRHSLFAQSLISSSVYHVEKLQKHLPDVYHQIYTMYPHLSLTLLAMLVQTPMSTAVTLPHCIVDYTTDGIDTTEDRMLPFVERAQNLRDLLPDAECQMLWEQSDFGRFLTEYNLKSGSRIHWSDILMASAFRKDKVARRTLRRAALAASAKFKSAWMSHGIFPLGMETFGFVLAVMAGTVLGPALRLAWAMKSKGGVVLPYRVRGLGLKSVQNILES